jgi:uncharacterized protein (TIGR04141 family)
MVEALDTDPTQRYSWSVWRCLVGEVEFRGETFILDEEEFFQVRSDYIHELDAAIADIPVSALPLPQSGAKTTEGEYNTTAAEGSDDLLLLDRQTVRISGRTTAIGICDLLTKTRQLVHVKRHLGSSGLSHLFAQGLVSADLLQNSSEFRQVAAAKVAEVAGNEAGFDFFDADVLRPSDFEVVYAVIEKWGGRSVERALPFFSKLNLREVSTNLRSWISGDVQQDRHTARTVMKRSVWIDDRSKSLCKRRWQCNTSAEGNGQNGSKAGKR